MRVLAIVAALAFAGSMMVTPAEAGPGGRGPGGKGPAGVHAKAGGKHGKPGKHGKKGGHHRPGGHKAPPKAA